MRWLTSKLRSLKKYLPNRSTQNGEDKLDCRIHLGTIKCEWKIRNSTKKLIERYFNSSLFLRVRDISGDGTNASVTVETTTRADHAEIHLPTTNGRILLELGYKAYMGDFITLDYKIYDLGEKKIKPIHYIDWFEIESDNIHQEMYEIATNRVAIGGSEERI